jgi:cyanophycin synthetase
LVLIFYRNTANNQLPTINAKKEPSTQKPTLHMKIVEIKVLKGPNYWSIRRNKLIQMKLDLEEMEQRPTNEIPGFRERLEKMFPSMYGHRCSVGEPGGFFMRVDEGTWMGHVIEHIALEMQTLAGMDCGFGRTRGTGQEGEYYVVFSYMEEDAGVFAAKAAVRVARALTAVLWKKPPSAIFLISGSINNRWYN